LKKKNLLGVLKTKNNFQLSIFWPILKVQNLRRYCSPPNDNAPQMSSDALASFMVAIHGILIFLQKQHETSMCPSNLSGQWLFGGLPFGLLT